MPLHLRCRDSALQRTAASPRAQRRPPSALCGPTAGEAIPRLLRSGQHLCWSGDRVAELWAVQHGSLKAYEISSGGAERVTGFFFPGDIIGWEGLACGSYGANTVALERTLVTPVSASTLLDGALGSAPRQALLLRGIGSEVTRLRERVALEQRSAVQRVAQFVLWIAECQGRGDGCSEAVRLPMSRKDIGSYLGLAIETVSRRLALFDRAGWIKLQRRSLWVTDERCLRRLTEAETE
jgi:CRP/FNR family transcriptional regulator, anaerobic regulatory protein